MSIEMVVTPPARTPSAGNALSDGLEPFTRASQEILAGPQNDRQRQPAERAGTEAVHIITDERADRLSTENRIAQQEQSIFEHTLKKHIEKNDSQAEIEHKDKDRHPPRQQAQAESMTVAGVFPLGGIETFRSVSRTSATPAENPKALTPKNKAAHSLTQTKSSFHQRPSATGASNVPDSADPKHLADGSDRAEGHKTATVTETVGEKQRPQGVRKDDSASEQKNNSSFTVATEQKTKLPPTRPATDGPGDPGPAHGKTDKTVAGERPSAAAHRNATNTAQNTGNALPAAIPIGNKTTYPFLSPETAEKSSLKSALTSSLENGADPFDIKSKTDLKAEQTAEKFSQAEKILQNDAVRSAAKTRQAEASGNTESFTPSPAVSTSAESSSVTAGISTAKGLSETAGVRPVDQIVQTLQLRTFGAESQVRMMLVPETLGAIRITFRQTDGQITGLLEVEKTDTRKDIEQSLGQLAAAMETAGVQVRRIEVVPWANNAGHQARNEQFSAEHNPTGDGRNPQFDSENGSPTTAKERTSGLTQKKEVDDRFTDYPGSATGLNLYL